MVELVRYLAISIPLHLPLIDRQDRTVISDGDDVAFHHPLLEMRAGESDPLVIGIVGLSFLFDYGPTRHGGTQSQRSNRCT
jgi:hypothetical protein